MKNSGIEWMGNIPDDTKVARLKYFVDIINGFAFQSDKFSDYGEINIVRISDIKQNYDFSKCVKYENFEGQENYMIKKDDILMAMSGGTYGKTLHLKNDIIEKNAINQRVCIIRGEQNIFNKYLFQTSAFFDYLSWRFMGAAQPNISAIDIGNFPIVLFEKSKAYIVANYLDGKCGKIDELIANQQGQIEKLKEYKQSVITEAVTKGLDKSTPLKDSGIEWIGEINNKHSVWKLKHLLSSPMMYGANESGEIYSENSVRYIRITDITTDNLLKDTEENLYLSIEKAKPYLLKDKEILFARSGGTVGKSFIYKYEYGPSAFAGYLIKAECDKERLLPEYLFYYTQSSLYELWKNMIFIQATIQNIGANKYSNMEIIIADIERQQQIVDYLDEKCGKIDRLIAIKQEKIEKLQEYKKSLIYEYVTGKKEVA